MLSKEKVKELRSYLIQYNGIPTQKENRAVYASVNYYIKNHKNDPEIKAIIDEFQLEKPEKMVKEELLSERIQEIKSILEKHGRIPKDNSDYNKVYYFFNHYQNEPEVKKLMYIYVHPDCYQNVIGKPLTLRSHGSYKYTCDDKSAYKYVRYVFENYNELPARHSAPMKRVYMEIGRYKNVSEKFKFPIQYKFKSLFNFLQEMKDIGCNDASLLEITQ